jgi:hypothetical protein
MFVAIADYPGLNTVGVGKTESDSIGLSTLYAWRAAVLNGRLNEAAGLRRYAESFEDEPSAADAEWQ